MTKLPIPRWPVFVRFRETEDEFELCRCHTVDGAFWLRDTLNTIGHFARSHDMMAGSFVLTLPLPAVALNPNRSKGAPWQRQARVKKAYKEAGFYAATDYVNRTIPRLKIPFPAIEIEPTFFFAMKRGRDGDNWAATIKAYQDGIEAAGIVENDKDVTNLPPIFKIDRDEPRVELLIFPVLNPEESDHGTRTEIARR